MKKLILFITLVTFGFTGTNAQSFEITPNSASVQAFGPDINLTGYFTPRIIGKRYQGTFLSPTPVVAGNDLLYLAGAGYTGIGYLTKAIVRMNAAENWSSSANGTYIEFITTPIGDTFPSSTMVFSDKGYLGLNATNPTVPFHVNYTNSTSNSSNGIAIFGSLGGQHLNFDGKQINAYNGTSFSPIYLNRFSAGAVVIGDLFAQVNEPDLYVSGFTKLGTGSATPRIKMKKLTGTTDATAGNVANIPHGIGSAAKILSIDIAVNPSSGTFVPENYTQSTNLEFNYYYNDINIDVVTKFGNSASILNKPIKIIITYEE